MPSRAYTSFLREIELLLREANSIPVSMPSRAYTSFLPKEEAIQARKETCVNALSGLYLISTPPLLFPLMKLLMECQCPLGLIPHFYSRVATKTARVSPPVSMPSRAYTSFLQKSIQEILANHPDGVNALSGLYLISTGYSGKTGAVAIGVNALSGLYLISTTRNYIPKTWVRLVSMPSRAYTSFLLILTMYASMSVYLCQCPLGLIPHFYTYLISSS